VNYYNEFDPFAAAWLRELIKDGRIPQGEVDERSIIEVEGSDLKGFTQCHFFAGIGGWSYALQLAGWESTRPVWTGSPPCQPFSTAGNRKGQDDERHLWPHFFSLIRECKPATVFGEQVAAAIRTEWFDDLQSDMENEGYATAMAVLPACSVGAPHKRERLFFVAHSSSQRQQGSGELRRPINPEADADREISRAEHDGSQHSALANSIDTGSQGRQEARRELSEHESRQGSQIWDDTGSDSTASPLGNAECDGLNGSEIGRGTGESKAEGWMCEHQGSSAILCRDGKTRQIPTEPALFPLANGIPNRVGLLRGAGNAIVPQVAAEVIKAVM
jgi:DNA (cytosine-5)-methyltransferase 1